MKLTKNDLKQLIREMMEAEEMEADDEETEGDSEGKIRIKAELRDDPAFEAAQEDAVGNDYGGQNTYEMAKYIVTLPDGEEIVIPDLRTLEDMEGDAVIGKAFGIAQGYHGGTEEDKIEGFKGAQGPGGIGEDGELIDNKRGTFQVFIDGFEIPKAGPASDELIKAFKKYKNRKPRYVSYKSTSRGPSRRKQYYDTYKEMPGGGPRSRSGYDRRYFKENKLTQSRLKQMIREEIKKKILERNRLIPVPDLNKFIKKPKVDIQNAEMVGGSPIGLPANLTAKVLAKVLAKEISIDQATAFLAKLKK